MATDDLKSRLLKEIADLEKQRDEFEAVLPAHGIKPHQIQRIEEVEERIARKKKELEALP